VLRARDRPDEHRAVERLTCHEVRELSGGASRVRHLQQSDRPRCSNPNARASSTRPGARSKYSLARAGNARASLIRSRRRAITSGRTMPSASVARARRGRRARERTGWVQTANFVLTGLIVIAAAVGFRRVLGPKSRATSLLLGGYGMAMIAAAIFPADPVDGFPPGTPEGFPTSISTTGLVHFIAGALAFTFLAISGFAAAWTMRRRVSSLALLSLFSGLAVVLGFFGGMVLPVGILGIWFAVVVGWAWLAVMSLRLGSLAQGD
jgi:Protein of unknown function (DUF998)